MKQTVIRSTIILLFSANYIPAQYLALKTVPVATGNQFLIFPAQTAGMGFVSIAVDDPLGAPFSNPALKGRNEKSFIYSTPLVSKPSSNEGQTQTIPLGYRFIGDNWYGTFSTAIQRIKDFNVSNNWRNNSSSNTSLNEHNNLFAFGSIGKSTRPNDYVGFSVLWAGLDGMQGVNLLYPRSTGVDQSGYLREFRIGTVTNLKNGESYETVLLRHEVSMEHKVTYNNWGWGRSSGFRVENEKDNTITNGFHFKYTRPFREDEKLGLIFTYNRKEHPKIPNYDIMNIPRDPGETNIFNLGLGFSRNFNDDIFAMDLIYEPASSHTWAEAARDIYREGKMIIIKGAKTVDNKFKFGNYRFNMGLKGKSVNNAEATFGMSFYKVNYTLNQIDYITDTHRTQNESWLEQTITWGLTKRFEKFNLYYNGNITLGTGSPSTRLEESGRGRLFFDGYTDFIVAPRGELLLNEIFLLTHQLTFVMPLR